MANIPKKVKDPTEAVLSAIQEALNISDAAAPDDSRGFARSEGSPLPASAVPAFPEGGFEARRSTDRPAFEPIEDMRKTRRPANDDRETIGQILQAIQKGRPARNVYTLATVFAGVWIIGCGLLTIFALPSL